jgi:hypothetical protein
LQTMMCLAWSTLRMGIPEMGVSVGIPGCRVHDVVGAYHYADVGLGKLVIDLFQFVQLLVGHIGLAEEDVHMAGHAASHRVNGVLDLGAPILQGIGQSLDQVLSLSQGHAVAGDDDDFLGLGQNGCGFRTLPTPPFPPCPVPGGLAATAAGSGRHRPGGS